MDDAELREIQRIAKSRHMTVAEWVHQVLRAARQGEAVGDPQKKMAAIRKASGHSFPAPDIDQMLDEVERG